jgi:glucosyl-dolichyl phosphate glucuronosyltransferase
MAVDLAGPVSIVVCTCKLDNYVNLTAAINSLLSQSYPAMEILVVVDGDQALHDKMLSDYGNHPVVKSFFLKENQGVSGARNAGIKAARGDIIAFLDDDAIAAEDWLDHLINTYREFGALAVGGKILPVWKDRAPDYLPDELYWLVGVTNSGFAAECVVEVRNTFGPNMSFKNEVFQKIGLFNQSFGFARTSHMQAEEPELALRMKQRLGKGVLYNPQAVVYHNISPEKTRVGGLLKRAFYQGYSKAFLNRRYASSGSMNSEKSYLGFLIFGCIPRRAIRFYRPAELKKTQIRLLTVH